MSPARSITKQSLLRRTVFFYNEAKAGLFCFIEAIARFMCELFLLRSYNFFAITNHFLLHLYIIEAKAGFKRVWRDTCQQKKPKDRWERSFGGRSVLSFAKYFSLACPCTVRRPYYCCILFCFEQLGHGNISLGCASQGGYWVCDEFFLPQAHRYT
jgi:hypothetical protein